jgi:IS30 family transposase
MFGFDFRQGQGTYCVLNQAATPAERTNAGGGGQGPNETQLLATVIVSGGKPVTGDLGAFVRNVLYEGNKNDPTLPKAALEGLLRGDLTPWRGMPEVGPASNTATPRFAAFFIGNLPDPKLRECCNASLFTSVGRGKRPNRGHEGGRPLDLRHRQGASTSEIHRVAGTAAQRPLERALYYSPLHAAGAYQLRRRREAILEKDQKLRTFVCDRLAEGWTPEQISGWLKAGNERRLRAVGCETIYAFIYRAYQKAEQLWRYLTRRHKRRRPRRSRPSPDTIKDRVSIHERPKTIDARPEAGHWEGDLIICKRTRPVLLLHELKSRVTLAARLIGKTAAETISVMLAVFDRIAPTLRKSIIFDNDTAFAQHGLRRTMRAMTTRFCDAYASWQKGGVENANGRLRRWLPRHTDIDKMSDEEIQDIVLTANLTPRKCLGFKTPFQAILKELGKDVQIRFS